MIRTQIQLTPHQPRALKRRAAKEGVSVAELIRRIVDDLMESNGQVDLAALRARALAAAGKLAGPTDLSQKHDEYLAETYQS